MAAYKHDSEDENDMTADFKTEAGLLRELLTELIFHPEALAIEEKAMGGNAVSFCVQAHLADTARLIGTGGKTYRAIATVMLCMGGARGSTIRVPTYREPSVGVPEQYRFTANPCWPKERIMDLLRRVLARCFRHVVTLQCVDGESDSVITATLSHRENSTVVRQLGEHVQHLFDAVGKANGRLLTVAMVQAPESDDAGEWQPETAAGRWDKGGGR